jgi:ATP-dependent Lon protease
MKNVIPIFPLGLVVFPNSNYPLHIFEERYIKMISKCLNNNAGLGIVAITDDDFSKIGSMVKISHIIKKYDSGEMDIVVTGTERFKILDLKKSAEGYFTAEIEIFEDEYTSLDSMLIDEMIFSFEKIINKLNFKLDESFWTRLENVNFKSFKLAEKSGLSIKQQLELLLMDNENKRAEYLIRYFNSLYLQIEDNSFMQNIIMGDGYIN